jgi:hypothetical protein
MWLSINGKYGRVGGPVSWELDTALRFAEFESDWPILRVRLVAKRRRSRIQTAVQARKSSWHAHLPRRHLAVPSSFAVTARTAREKHRLEGEWHVFDFTGSAALPDDDLDRRLVVLLDEIESFRRHHPEVFERFGVTVAVSFHDEVSN